MPASVSELAAALNAAGYIADEPLTASVFLALRMHRPLYCEGEPGVGKTALAHAVSAAFGWPLFRLQCYEGLDASEALYSWDFARQLLHLKAAPGTETVEDQLYDRRFLRPRPILRAFETTPSVLLIDEIDRADDEFEAFLLEALSDFSVTVPELGTIKAATPPFVLVTSNRTREVHDALKRRCLYQWIDHPSPATELAIIRQRFPMIAEPLAREIVAAVSRLRQADLLKAPGIAESLDWAEALLAFDAETISADTVALTLGTVVKYHEDQLRLRKNKFAPILDQ